MGADHIERLARRTVGADGTDCLFVKADVSISMVAHCGQSFLTPYSASKGALATRTKNVDRVPG